MNVLEIAKYPFLDQAREYARDAFDLSFIELVDEAYYHAWKRAVERIMEAIREREIHQDARDLFNYRTEILSFPLAVALVACVGDDRLRGIFALAEAKRAKGHLDNESPLYLIQFAKQIGIETMKKDDDLFGISVQSYLKFASAFKGVPKWKLVNRVVTGGYVMINKSELKRLIQEGIKEIILAKSLKQISIDELPEKYRPDVQKIRENWDKVIRRYSDTSNVTRYAIPPCMTRLKNRMEAGENLSHVERLALASYLINIGTKLDDIIQIFSASPDFNLKVSRYQIEHLAGLRGSKKRYTTPSCVAMRKYGLCFPDSGCIGIKNPLNYKVTKQ